MEPITGFFLYIACAAIVAAIAWKKGLRWGWSFAGILILGPLMVTGASIATEGHVNGMVAALLAFLVPMVALIVVLTGKNEQQLAAGLGSTVRIASARSVRSRSGSKL